MKKTAIITFPSAVAKLVRYIHLCSELLIALVCSTAYWHCTCWPTRATWCVHASELQALGHTFFSQNLATRNPCYGLVMDFILRSIHEHKTDCLFETAVAHKCTYIILGVSLAHKFEYSPSARYSFTLVPLP